MKRKTNKKAVSKKRVTKRRVAKRAKSAAKRRNVKVARRKSVFSFWAE